MEQDKLSNHRSPTHNFHQEEKLCHQGQNTVVHLVGFELEHFPQMK